jgi:hypothetical protein
MKRGGFLAATVGAVAGAAAAPILKMLPPVHKVPISDSLWAYWAENAQATIRPTYLLLSPKMYELYKQVMAVEQPYHV